MLGAAHRAADPNRIDTSVPAVAGLVKFVKID